MKFCLKVIYSMILVREKEPSLLEFKHSLFSVANSTCRLDGQYDNSLRQIIISLHAMDVHFQLHAMYIKINMPDYFIWCHL